VSTELAGPESVPFGGGPGISGSVGLLTVGTTLRGSSGYTDPSVVGSSVMQSRVLSGRGVPAAAATVEDSAERGENTRSTVERASLPPNRTLNPPNKRHLTNVAQMFVELHLISSALSE